MYLGFTDLMHSNGKKYKYSTMAPGFTGFTDLMPAVKVQADSAGPNLRHSLASQTFSRAMESTNRPHWPVKIKPGFTDF